MAALTAPDGIHLDPFADLCASIAAAYEQVRQARRCLNAIPASGELQADLQRAEADLVRAMVAADSLSFGADPGSAAPLDRLVSIAQHRELRARSA